MVCQLWWCAVLLSFNMVALAVEPATLHKMPLQIQGSDPSTRALLPALAVALCEGLKVDGIELEPTVDGAPVPAALRIRVMATWNPMLEGVEIDLSGHGGWSAEAHVLPVSAHQKIILRDRTALAACLNEQALLLARFLVRGARSGRVESSGPAWVPGSTSTIGLTLVEGKNMKLDGPRPPLDYPWPARIQRVKGTVSMDLRVDGKGRVAQVSILEGHPLLADTALKYFFQRRFLVPSDWNGLGFLNFNAGVRFDLPVLSKVARTVVEIANGKTIERAIQPELGVVAKKVTDLLTAEGIEVVPGDDSADPELRRLRVEIESLCPTSNLNLYGVRVDLSRFKDPKPSESGNLIREGMVVGQTGSEGLQVSLDATLEEVLRSVVDPPRPRQSVLSGLARPDLDVVELDFSQMRVKRQPPPPRYPPEARDRRIQGTVVVELVVGEDGRPIRGQVRTGPPELMLAALNYALDWTFEPARLNGVAMRCRFKLTMPFKLR